MPERLTAVEQQVLDLLSMGTPHQEVCARLSIDEHQLAGIWESTINALASMQPESIDDYELLLQYERVQRRHLESEVWASEARLNALMDISPEAVFVVQGRSGRILKVNNQVQLMLGYTARDLVGRSVEMLVPPDKRAIHVAYRNGFLNSVRKREMGYHPLIEALKKDGTTIQLEIALTATQATDDVMVVCRQAEEVKMDGARTESSSRSAE